jgi:hypothetical protein
MPMTSAARTALLNLIFNNTDWANVGDAAGLQNSAAAGSFFLSLHTADPGLGGSQTTNETAYTGYTRVAVARTAGGWTISGNNASNTAIVAFPNCTAAPGGPITHVGVGSAVSGAGNLQFIGTVSPSYQPAIGNAPEFAVGAMDIDLT